MLATVRMPLALSVALLAISTTGAGARAQDRTCALSPADQAWVDGSIAAWRLTTSQITHLTIPSDVTTILFSADCTLVSQTAMVGEGPVTGVATANHGQIDLPGGETMPAVVTSYASEGAGHPFFVMSTPSVWSAGGVPGGPMGLEKLMTAVLLHEGSHVSQSGTYMRQFSDIAETQQLPTDFNDDTIQKRFRDDADFAGSVAREIDLLFAAAASPDDQTAHQLAGQALGMIQARRAAFYTGDDAFLAEVEDVFLTLEGSGQWAGYQWLIHPQGGRLVPSEVVEAFGRRGGWWSQTEGLALLLATDRVGNGSWKSIVFGDGGVAGIALLQAALDGTGVSPPP